MLDPEQARWVRHHHERWDGAGYPAARAADAIPDGAQLLALADVWDTMTYGRPYRAALTPENALAEIDHVAGTHLRPDAAAAPPAPGSPPGRPAPGRALPAISQGRPSGL